jgi:hypothetical protein
MRIRGQRQTRHFLLYWIRCRCRKAFSHRADRGRVVCFFCGRIAALALLLERRAAARARQLAREKAERAARRALARPVTAIARGKSPSLKAPRRPTQTRAPSARAVPRRVRRTA